MLSKQNDYYTQPKLYIQIYLTNININLVMYCSEACRMPNINSMYRTFDLRPCKQTHATGAKFYNESPCEHK